MKPTRLLPAQHEIVTYSHSPEYGVTLDAVMQPEYWAHVAHMLRPGYCVILTAADMSWRAELMVRAASRTEALMGLVSHAEFGAAADVAPDNPDYEIKWRGPARKYSVLRRSDGAVVKEDFQAREQAAQWIKNHLQAMAA